MVEVSKMWENLTLNQFEKIDGDFLADFRAPGSANKFVAWDPYEHSTRYLKFLLFTAAQKQPQGFFDAYKRINNCSYGEPLSIRYADCDINTDYFSSIEEWLFLNTVDAFDEVSNIVEIGAGFGRTCHAIMTLCPDIKEYTIVDLPPMLNLSRMYLKNIAPDFIHRIRFVSSDDIHSQDLLSPDLVINIDSFQEMPLSTIDGYMNRIVKKATKFYCKNTVGKYLPESIGMPSLSQDKILDAFSLGRCTDILDIFNDEELERAHDGYVEKYTPPTFNGVEYKVIATKGMDLFPYFCHALYAR